MAEVFYDSFGPKIHDDRCSRNVTIGALLAHLGSTFGSAVVSLDADVPAVNPDSALTFDNGGVMAYDATAKKLSFIEEGGTRGAKYLLAVRITLADGRRYTDKFWQEITA